MESCEDVIEEVEKSEQEGSWQEGGWQFQNVLVERTAQLSPCSPPSFSVHGIFQARILEWVVISYSKNQVTGKKV